MTARGPRYIAQQLGQRTYVSGTACKRGHVTPRNTRDGCCLECKAMLEAVRVATDRKAYNTRKRQERQHKLQDIAQRARELRTAESIPKREIRLAKAKENARQWRSKNPKHHLALTTAHKATVKRQTPRWADRRALVAVYTACPTGYQVDHILPLRGTLVSGLHVADNLQYLPAADNRAKSNKFLPT